jgi:hypothetical protein
MSVQLYRRAHVNDEIYAFHLQLEELKAVEDSCRSECMMDSVPTNEFDIQYLQNGNPKPYQILDNVLPLNIGVPRTVVASTNAISVIIQDEMQTERYRHLPVFTSNMDTARVTASTIMQVDESTMLGEQIFSLFFSLSVPTEFCLFFCVAVRCCSWRLSNKFDKLR